MRVIIFKLVYFQRMSEGRQLLEYYQGKIDELYKQRLAWLSKFDQCNALLKEKQQLMSLLKDHKDKQVDLHRGLVHHDVALLDEKLNVVRMDRENINNEFMDAEEILKMEELMEEYPQELEKHLPCKVLSNGGPIIQNQLNIHAAKNKGKSSNLNIFRQNNSVLSNGKVSDDPRIKYKPTKEQLLKRQIIQLKTNQQKEICLLKQQKRKLQELLKSVREKEEQALHNERDILQKLRSQLRKQQQKHKQLAEKYFQTRKALKGEYQDTKNENQKLKATLASLELKVNEEMRIYEKENKAKQTLILRKSEDFQEDYKAKMRAKERNLQALRDNYEKMQEVCIQKIRQLEQTLATAKHKFNETEKKRQIQIAELKAELNVLERQVGEERAEKARIDQIMRNKIEQDKRKRILLQEKEEDERRKNERTRQLQQAYKQTNKTPKQPNFAKPKPGKPSKEPVKVYDSQSEDSDEESMALSDLENIRQQIHKLQNKLDQKSRKVK